MDCLDGLLELLKFEVAHDEIIFMWGITDKEQNLEVKYFDIEGDSENVKYKIK